jgi:sec-independent protein translocase protein TatA
VAGALFRSFWGQRTQNIKEKLSKGGKMLGQIGAPELLLFFLIILLLFGASRLRDVGGALGGAIRDFRSAVSGENEEQGQQEEKEDQEA